MSPLYERYHRQLILKNFGKTAQDKLWQAKVLVVGAGGLGCATLQYLTAAGIGTIGIIDDDVVTLNNLHRQVLYSEKDIGLSKAERAAFVLQQLNSDIKIIKYNERLATANALDIIQLFDVIVDCSDNFPTRYMINDACVLIGKPLVYASISQYEGQVAIFNYKNEDGIVSSNYRDVFPKPPDENTILNCEEAGVLGVLPGIIGTMQANETIKLITGIGTPLVNRLLNYNALTNEMTELILSPRKETPALIPPDAASFQTTNYYWLCAPNAGITQIDVNTFDSLLNENDIDIIDVREVSELPVVTEFHHRKFPLSTLKENMPLIDKDTVVAFCQSGKRSLQAARLLFDTFGTSKKIYSLQGGIIAWKKYH